MQEPVLIGISRMLHGALCGVGLGLKRIELLLLLIVRLRLDLSLLLQHLHSVLMLPPHLLPGRDSPITFIQVAPGSTPQLGL